MDDKQKENWSRVRRMGQLRYALFYGGVAWGLPFGFIFVLGSFIFGLIKNYPAFSFLNGDFIGRSIFQVVVLFLSGSILGYLMWGRHEEEYLKSDQSNY